MTTTPRPHEMCADCHAGPRDLGGHAGITLDHVSSRLEPTSGPIYRCTACGTRWQRSYSEGVGFLWFRAGTA